MEQPIIANGGLQIVPQIAVQYVYLDFDGELTSYNGEILTVGNVEVKDSLLPEERIQDIIAELNAKYSSKNVIFVAERPADAEYSTIFIGKTDAFTPYGDFIGLAETIDAGNLIKDDNAFVFLDATSTNSEIINTIAHETDHLLGTLDHGGSGLNAYAAAIAHIYYNLTGSGNVNISVGLFVNSVNYSSVAILGNVDEVYYGYRKIISGVIAGDGYVDVSSGGIVESTAVISGGQLYVRSGGYVSNITVYDGGAMGVAGKADDIIVNQAGRLTIAQSSVVNRISVAGDCSCHYWYGNINSVILTSGATVYASGAQLTDVNMDNTSVMLAGSSILKNADIQNGGIVDVRNGTVTTATLKSNAGILITSGVVSNINILGGYLDIPDAKYLKNIDVELCDIFVQQGGRVGTWTQTGQTALYIEEMNFDSAFILTNVSGRLHGSGTIVVTDSLITDNVIEGAGTVTLLNTEASNTIVSSGCLIVSSGSIVDDVAIEHGGSIAIYGGNVSDISMVKGDLYLSDTGNLEGDISLICPGYKMGNGSQMTITSEGKISDESTLTIVLDNASPMSYRDSLYAVSMLNDINKIDNIEISISVSGTVEKEGTYIISENFSQNDITGTSLEKIDFLIDGKILEGSYENQYSFTWNEDCKKYTGINYNGYNYILAQENNQLVLNVVKNRDTFAMYLGEDDEKLNINLMIEPLKEYCKKTDKDALPEDICIVVYADGFNIEDDGYYFVVGNGGFQKLIQDRELDSSKQLPEFIKTVEKFQAVTYSFHGSGHGGGITGIFPDKHIGLPDTGCELSIPTFVEELSSNNIEFSSISLNCCLMSSIEVIAALRKKYQSLKYIVASEETLAVDGLDYSLLYQSLDEEKWSNRSLWNNVYDALSKYDTKAIINPGAVDSFIDNLDGFAQALVAVGDSYPVEIVNILYSLFRLDNASVGSVKSYCGSDLKEFIDKINEFFTKELKSIQSDNPNFELVSNVINACNEISFSELVSNLALSERYKDLGGINVYIPVFDIDSEKKDFNLKEFIKSVMPENWIILLDKLPEWAKTYWTVRIEEASKNGITFELPGSSIEPSLPFSLEISTNGFANSLHFHPTSNQVDFFGLPAGSFGISVTTGNNEGTAEATIISDNTNTVNKFTSDEDGNMDLFFANTNGVWGKDYAAEHQGILKGWTGTNEQVTLAGKNKISDVFSGSSDANILVMTDDTNGDALFVDDIYTALPGTVAEQQARIAQIDEIRAGLGDDIVDMTSQRFTYIGDGVKIYGGDGNDTLWANNGNNTLFGDAGNDRLVGASGNDILAGGSGNDSMHGGGGDDIFTFGGAFGNDTVEQLASGSVTLWFETGSESNWNAETGVYSDGTNTVSVSGSVNVTLRFGADADLPAGAFAEAASEKIFEDKESGMLA